MSGVFRDWEGEDLKVDAFKNLAKAVRIVEKGDKTHAGWLEVIVCAREFLDANADYNEGADQPIIDSNSQIDRFCPDCHMAGCVCEYEKRLNNNSQIEKS